MVIEWVIQTLNGYLGDDSTTALIILGMVTVVLLIPFGIGVWMLRRDHHRTPSIST
jgi:cytochrome oxidase assembly protein ShyY1